MATRPWRGTLIYVGAAAAMAAAGVSRFAGVEPQVSVPTATSSTTDATGSTGSTATPSTDSGSTAGSAGAASTDSGATATSDTVTIVGAAVQNRYGSVQVSVTFTGTQITDVQTLQSPNRERESQQISQRSTPVLAQEVLAAQSAQIDTVSGATYTSQSYVQSVQSAIDQRG
jgi:uncharacterized protein with FMN-binding domain